MNIRVIAIDQRLALGTQGEMQNFLVLELPNGKEARAAIDLETTKQLLQLDAEDLSLSDGSNGAGQPAVQHNPVDTSWNVPAESVSTMGLQPPSQQPQQPMEATGPIVGATEAETVEWAKLADEILHPSMKAAFLHLKMGPRLTPAQIRSIEQEVHEKFGPEEWQEVLGPLAESMMPQRRQPAAAPQPAPALGAVQWADGAPMVSHTRPSRTVPKTKMGYPIPQDGTVDPGEVVGGEGMDEDGVGQL